MGTEASAEETEESAIPGWFRADIDALGTQLWFGASHELGGLTIASDIYTVGSIGEFDIGPSFTLIGQENNNLSVIPMIGLEFDFGTMNMTALVPQFYTFWAAGSLYFESWLLGFFFAPFDDDPLDSTDILYTRNFLRYGLSDVVAVGPQIELTINLEDEAAGGVALDSLASLIVGGNISLAYGEHNALELFLGYQTKEELREGNDGIAGRFTFIRHW
jgi:hypothetical protein